MSLFIVYGMHADWRCAGVVIYSEGSPHQSDLIKGESISIKLHKSTLNCSFPALWKTAGANLANLAPPSKKKKKEKQSGWNGNINISKSLWNIIIRLLIQHTYNIYNITEYMQIIKAFQIYTVMVKCKRASSDNRLGSHLEGLQRMTVTPHISINVVRW